MQPISIAASAAAAAATCCRYKQVHDPRLCRHIPSSGVINAATRASAAEIPGRKIVMSAKYPYPPLSTTAPPPFPDSPCMHWWRGGGHNDLIFSLIIAWLAILAAEPVTNTGWWPTTAPDGTASAAASAAAGIGQPSSSRSCSSFGYFTSYFFGYFVAKAAIRKVLLITLAAGTRRQAAKWEERMDRKSNRLRSKRWKTERKKA